MSSHVGSLLLLAAPMHVATMRLQREQHGQRRHMGMMVAVAMIVMAMVMMVAMSYLLIVILVVTRPCWPHP
jgi:hypothetical protein